jgi:hypothetical protein
LNAAPAVGGRKAYLEQRWARCETLRSSRRA